ncbi:MAG: hypothetical protein PVJ30_04480 [Thiohalocapsa sp.]
MSPAQRPDQAAGHRPRRQDTTTRSGRRHALSSLAHRVLLLLTLALGAGALVYNAVSIVNGDSGLMGLPALSGAGWTDPAPSFCG